MKSKTVIIVIGLLALAFGISTLPMAKEPPHEEPKVSSPKEAQAINPTSDSGKAAPQVSHKIIAYYFHGTARCPSCRKIEAYTHEAIQGSFADYLKDGRLEWHVVNVDEPDNEHFVKDYQLYTKSVVITDNHDGKQTQWKNLEKVWRLLNDKEAFLTYIRDEVKSYVGKN